MIRALLLMVILSIRTESEPRLGFTYEEKPKLSWSDFKGIPLNGLPYQASTNCGIVYRFKSQTIAGKLQVQTEAHSYFYPELSWKRNIDESDPALLAHEQLHWDITELHTQMLRKEFARYIPRKNPKKDIQAIFEKIEQQRKAMQIQYDKETNHGRNKTAQHNWEIMVMESRFRL